MGGAGQPRGGGRRRRGWREACPPAPGSGWDESESRVGLCVLGLGTADGILGFLLGPNFRWA